MFRRRGGYRRVHAAVESVDAGEASQENLAPDRSRYASEISSSLSLQILIYYNGLLSAVYFVLEGGLVIEKVRTCQNYCYVTVYSYEYRFVQARLLQLVIVTLWYYCTVRAVQYSVPAVGYTACSCGTSTFKVGYCLMYSYCSINTIIVFILERARVDTRTPDISYESISYPYIDLTLQQYQVRT